MLRILSIAGTVLLLALPIAAQQQDSSSSSQQSQSSSASAQGKDQSGSATAKKNSDQKPATKPSSTPNQNAFPEAQSEKAAQQQQQDSAPAAPAPQTAQSPKGSSTADQNPFPEAQSEKAAQQDQQDQQKAGQDYSSSGVKGLNLPAQAAPLAAGAPGNAGFSPGLARKDVKVGNFYLQTRDYKGAYDRFLEATQVNPGSADAVYGLAVAAQHLNKRDVALQYYQLYLAALPDGSRAKDARKALKEIGAEPKQ